MRRFSLNSFRSGSRDRKKSLDEGQANVDGKLTQLHRIMTSTHPGYGRDLPGQSRLHTIYGQRRIDRISCHINCDEVYPNILIGDQGSAKNKNYLRLIGVTHVLNCAEGSHYCQVNTGGHYYAEASIKYMGINVIDVPQAKISLHFHECSDFIDRALQNGGRLLIHCMVGLSRSATIALAYLMLKRDMSLEEALRTVRKQREVRPNDGFLKQLIDLESRIRSGNSMLFAASLR
ncbi:Dual specificity protein phosphatase 13 isoform A [Halotydeus destructor]|nr:Dual specificity protein phosphatase 13 isoform A [Halotydeus destructor]